MSKVKAYLCSCIIKEHFGDIVEKVTAYLLENGYKSLKEICKNVKLTREEVSCYSMLYTCWFGKQYCSFLTKGQFEWFDAIRKR